MTAASRPLPLLGAALSLDMVELHRDWLFERDRDLELQDFFEASVLDGDWRDRAERAKRVLSGWNGRLGIHGPFWGFKIDSEDPEIRAVVTSRLLQGLEAAEAIGATQMVIHSPFTTWDANNLDYNRRGRESLFERTHLTLAAVVKRAEEIGCTLVMENIEDKDPDDRVELVKSFASEAVRVSLDVGHALYAHRSTGAPPVDYYVRAAGSLLHHVHVQDADGHADRHWLPGEGLMLWPSFFKAVADWCETPRLLIEVKDQPRLMKGAAHLVGLGLAE
ncbi:sugar phosphate isomerase/epimerase family protein [Pinisolibacter sp.]|uniref:sugar phosphate isomerase/epimerase family protein n=1 Tax=Pinisolibacter sp. TaxID=2172024 RepID=UPI002FDDC190